MEEFAVDGGMRRQPLYLGNMRAEPSLVCLLARRAAPRRCDRR